MTGTQMTFDQLEAQRRQEVGMAQSEARASKEWMDMALNAVQYLKEKQAFLTTDDVWALVPPCPSPTATMGMVMRRSAKKGWIEPTTSTEKSKRKACNCRPIRVWRSLPK